MPNKKPSKKQYKEIFATEGQRVTRDGKEVIMQNGRRFKRTVLPSVAQPKPATPEEQFVEQELEQLDDWWTKAEYGERASWSH